MIVSTVIVSTFSQCLNLLCNSTATRKPYSICSTVSPKARHPHHFLCNLFLSLVFCFCNVCSEIKGSLSTDDFGLTLQTRWRESAPKTRKIQFPVDVRGSKTSVLKFPFKTNRMDEKKTSQAISFSEHPTFPKTLDVTCGFPSFIKVWYSLPSSWSSLIKLR